MNFPRKPKKAEKFQRLSNYFFYDFSWLDFEVWIIGHERMSDVSLVFMPPPLFNG